MRCQQGSTIEECWKAALAAIGTRDGTGAIVEVAKIVFLLGRIGDTTSQHVR